MKRIAKTLLLLCLIIFVVSKTNAQVTIIVSANIAPPELPVYEQPACPTDGYLWVPGYWAYDATNGYYWVPGVWTAPPNPGLLWTPAYWGYDGGVYGFHAGYWGATIGFYGGINYGYGYSGVGFEGGRWEGGAFRYNTAVMHVNTVVIHNTYEDRTVIRDREINHASFNGRGGIDAHPRPEDEAAMRDRHYEATSEQRSHEQVASKDRNQLARVNGGHPAAAAMNRVGGTPVRELPRGGSAPNVNRVNGAAGNPNGQVNANNKNGQGNSNGQKNANNGNTQGNANGQKNANNGNAQGNANGQKNANNGNTQGNANGQKNANNGNAQGNANGQVNANNKNAAGNVKSQTNTNNKPANNAATQQRVQQQPKQPVRPQPHNTPKPTQKH